MGHCCRSPEAWVIAVGVLRHGHCCRSPEAWSIAVGVLRHGSLL